MRFIPVVACSMLVHFCANCVHCVFVPQFSYELLSTTEECLAYVLV